MRIPNNLPKIEVAYILFIKQSPKSEVNRNPLMFAIFFGGTANLSVPQHFWPILQLLIIVYCIRMVRIVLNPVSFESISIPENGFSVASL
jgi:hypothetical protein